MVVINEENEGKPMSTASEEMSIGTVQSADTPNRVGATLITDDEEDIQYICKKMLHNKLFVGHYQERRYVEYIKTYRDVVVVHKSEADLKKDLDDVKRRLAEFQIYNMMWFGFTGPDIIGAPAGHALWVKLHDLPFGHYWFQIKNLKFGESEIVLRLKVIRPLEMSDSLEQSQSECNLIKSASQQSVDSNRSRTSTQATGTTADVNSLKDWSDSIPTLEECSQSVTELKNSFIQNIIYFFVTFVTFRNLKEVCRFFAAFVLATGAGFLHAIQFIGDFSIKFMRESAVFIEAATPIILGVIDFFTKLVGGMYILLAMMWRGKSIQAPPEYVPPAFKHRPLAIQPSSSKMRFAPQSPYI